MIGRIQKLIKSGVFQNTLIFSASSIVNKAIPFLLAPVITRFLTPEDYGVVATFTSLLTFIVVFTGVNAHGFIRVHYFRATKDELTRLVSTVMVILLLSSLVVFGVMFLVGSWIEQTLNIPYWWLMLGVLCAMGMFITNVHLLLWQLRKEARRFAIYEVAQTIVNIGLSLILIIDTGLSWRGRLTGLAVALIGFAIISLFYIHKMGYLKRTFDHSWFRSSFRFGASLIPHNGSTWLRTGINIYLITSLVGLHESGLYNLGNQFAMIVLFIANAFNLAISPGYYEKLSNFSEIEGIRLMRITYGFSIFMLVLATGVSLLTPWVITNFFDERYVGAIPFIPWLSFSFAFFGMFFTVVHYLFFHKKTVRLSLITLSSGILNSVLSYFLIPEFGPIAAAWSSFASFGLMFIAVAIYANRVHPMPWTRFKALLQ